MSKQAIITAVLILLISNYVSFQVGQTRLYYKQYSQRASQATAKDEPVYGVDQVLSFSPSKLDLGTVAKDQVQQRSVSFQNRGSEKVVIKRARSSCGCTVAIVRQMEVAPGGQGTLDLRFDPRLSAPQFAISVSVEYEGRPQVDRLLLTGQVAP